MKEWSPNPKPIKKEKVVDKNYWNNLRAKSAKKSLEKNKEQIDLDKKFFLESYERFVKENRWHCANCGIDLPRYTGTEASYKIIRSVQHHCLEKSNYEQFRYTFENIIPLCSVFVSADNCHSQAESVVSLPKMNAYKQIIDIKTKLLFNE